MTHTLGKEKLTVSSAKCFYQLTGEYFILIDLLLQLCNFLAQCKHLRVIDALKLNLILGCKCMEGYGSSILLSSCRGCTTSLVV